MTAPRPGAWVNHEATCDAPWRSQEGIVKIIEFPVRRPEMSRRAFHLYWQRHHSPHVMNATGFSQFMRKYMTAHVYPQGPGGLPPQLRVVPHFEGAGEVWLNSLDDAIAWLGHPLYAELIAPDEANFVDHNGGGEVLVTKEERLHDDDRDLEETGLTKLYIAARRRVGLERADFHEAVSKYARDFVAGASLRQLVRRFVVSHRLPDPYPEWLPPAETDVVLEMWFESRETMQRFLAEGASTRFPLEDSGIFEASSLRAVVTRLHVVHDEFSFQSSAMQPKRFSWDD